jgi:hypothetical protein
MSVVNARGRESLPFEVPLKVVLRVKPWWSVESFSPDWIKERSIERRQHAAHKEETHVSTSHFLLGCEASVKVPKHQTGQSRWNRRKRKWKNVSEHGIAATEKWY